MSPIIHPPRELKPLSRKLSPLWLVLAAWLAGCGSGTSLPDCDSVRQVVVTDIDETLTTSDAESSSSSSTRSTIRPCAPADRS